MHIQFTRRFLFAVFAMTPSFAAFGQDWYGTMSCGGSTTAARAGFSAPVFLSIDGKTAKIERVWKKGEERQQGSYSRGQTLRLMGTGFFHGRQVEPWRTTTVLNDNGHRFEGTAVIESSDGKTRYHDCQVAFEPTSTVAVQGQESRIPGPRAQNQGLPPANEGSSLAAAPKGEEKNSGVASEIQRPEIAGMTAVVEHTDPESFYDIRTVSTNHPPGTPVRTTEYSRSRLSGSTNSRFMYLSVDGNGSTVAATAAIAIPKGLPPAGGWPVIAWAHGTVGIGKNCAPSMTDDLSKYGPYVQGFINRGYAVVAADYSGLGTDGRHFYSHRESNARDLIESVRTASKLYPSLGNSFVAVGHSQGGLAAIGVSETIGKLDIAPLRFKGAVAIAPGNGFVQQYFSFTERNGARDPSTIAYLMMYAAAVQLEHPHLRHTDQLSADVADLMPTAKTQCLDDLRATVKSSLSFPKYFVLPAWTHHPDLKKYSEKNQAGSNKAAEPILIVWGSADTSISKNSLDNFIRSSCRLGSDIQFNQYPGANHATVLTSAGPDIFLWIGRQLSGTHTGGVCGEAFKPQ